MPEQGSWRPTDKPQEGSWSPQPSGVHQICYLLAEVQKPGSDQGQVRGDSCSGGPRQHIWDSFSVAQLVACTVHQRIAIVMCGTPPKSGAEGHMVLT